jgi:putative heme-binding domain-containing protein
MTSGLLALVVLLPASAVGLAEESKQATIAPLVRLLQTTDDLQLQRDVLNGMYAALQGRRSVSRPQGWTAVYQKLSASSDAGIRQKSLVLSVLFDDSQALNDLRRAIANRAEDADWRRFALQTLIDKRPSDLAAVLKTGTDDQVLRSAALRGFAASDDASVAEFILTRYSRFTDSEKTDAIATLASRSYFALSLLDAIERGTIPRRDVSSVTARQLLAMKDEKVNARLSSVWGAVRSTSKEKASLLAKYKAIATADAIQQANRVHGRQLFSKMCATCHTLFDEGAKIGPELTGSQRANPEYILTKVLDPNGVVPREYHLTCITTRSGRTVCGIVKEENEKIVVLQTPNEIVRVPLNDIEERIRVAQSMMPEGLLNDRSDSDVRDLLAYLASGSQVALPK